MHPQRPRGRQRRAPGRPDRLRRPRHRRGRPGARRRPERQARRHGRRLRGPAREQPGHPAEDREGRRPRSTSSRTHRFVGFDAYKQVIASGVDVVLLCTPPHFRPHPPPRGRRGRQARLRREAGRRRCPRRPLASWRPASWPRRRASRSSPASACATTTASARPSAHPRRRHRRRRHAHGQRLPERPLGQAAAARTGPT